MGQRNCCVINCKNTSLNSKCKFFRFPVTAWRSEQRRQWINAIKRKNDDGSLWFPKPHDVICSDHFIGGKKSDVQLNPSNIPTIFPSCYKSSKINELMAINRHERFMKRRSIKKEEGMSNITVNMETKIDNTKSIDVITDDTFTVNEGASTYKDQECQANIIGDFNESSKTFVCNRFIYNNSVCDAEIQTDIVEISSVKVIPNRKKYKDKQCGTPEKILVDKCIGFNFENEKATNRNFNGISSVCSDEQLTDLAGVTFTTFNFLLKRTDAVEKRKISKENRLLIFLIKMKTGLTFSALSVLFCIHRTTVSRIFFSVLQQLTHATANLLFWPDKDVVQGTMPECFHPDYSNTRVIIDCTEFRIDVPATVENRVLCYSHYKKGFTAKLLIGITPGGFISFKSKVAGGRKSDSQITIQSGLIDLLEDDDVVLANKGFPDIRSTINEQGKKVLLVMPPFLEKKDEFSKSETEDTYSIARVRIHIERIMQRLRTYQILNKIHENLFDCVDDIVHMCCVLVNLQPPIISDEKEV